MSKVNFPFGNADVQTKSYAAAIAITAENTKTIVNIGQLTGGLALTVVPDPELKKGAELLVKLQSDGTARDTTLGSGFTGVTVAGVINKTKYATFIYDGSTFVNTAVTQVN